MPNKDDAEKGDHSVEEQADGHRHRKTQDAADFCIVVLPELADGSHLSSDACILSPVHAGCLSVCTGQTIAADTVQQKAAATRRRRGRTLTSVSAE